MSHKSSFFNAVQSGGVYDRTYNAADFAEFFAQFIGNGVYANPSSGLQVVASSGMQISINPGYAWINGYMFSVLSNTTDSLSLNTADVSYNRIDSIVVGLNLTNREITPYVRTGSPSSNPSPVSLVRTSTIYEIELAQILIPAGSSSITQASITDMRSNSTRCGWVTGLIDQIDTTDLFAQFTAKFNEWLETYQDVLDEDTAANLLSQILSLKNEVESRGRYSATHYTGTGQSGSLHPTTLTLPFAPRRVEINQVDAPGYSLFESLYLLSTDGNTYVGRFTRFTSAGTVIVAPVTVSKTTSGSDVVLSWYSTQSVTHQMNENGKTYYVSAWGV